MKQNLVLGFFCLLSLSACSLEQRVFQAGGDAVNPAVEETRRQAMLAPVGLQNFRQAVAAREAATGSQLDFADRAYRQVLALLSADGDSHAANSPMLVAVGTLSGIFCEKLVTREAANAAQFRRYFRTVDFGASARMTDAVAGEVAADVAQLALQRAPTAPEATALKTAALEAQAGTSSNPSRIGVLTACAAAFTSPDAITQ